MKLKLKLPSRENKIIRKIILESDER